MKIKLNREELINKFSLASRFTSSKLSSIQTLQGVYFKKQGNKIHLYSSNLSAFFHTTINIEPGKDEEFVLETKKPIEFLSFLTDAKIELEKKDKQILIKSEKTSGAFPLMSATDFPLPPKIEEKKQKIGTKFLTQNLPLILFSASADETRPALSGINLLTNGELVLVATDGFRLSMVKTKKEKQFPSAIIPAGFLREITHFIKEEKEVDFSYSAVEKVVLFAVGETEFYSRLIEGEFPPFEKVIPQEKKTTVKLDKEEFLRNIKLISVFARDFSHIIILEINKDGVRFMPKTADAKENSSFQDGEIEGEKQRVAFNYKFLLDFLSVVDTKNIIIEILRSDAPVVFKLENNPDYLHIIMPVRIQE